MKEFRESSSRRLARACDVVRSVLAGVLERIEGLDELVAGQASVIEALAADVNRLRDEELKKLRDEIESHRRTIGMLERERASLERRTIDRFTSVYGQIESKITEFYKCIDLVKGKRDLDYMTVDEYFLAVEPSRRGPIADEVRKKHESELDVLMKEYGLQPGMVRAPFDKLHRTYPRDVIIDHLDGK